MRFRLEHRRRILVCAVAAIAAWPVSGAVATTFYFGGNLGDGSSWGDPNNWSPFGIPNSNDAVINGHTVYVNGAFSVGSLTMDSTANLWIQTSRSLLVLGPTVSNSGSILIDDTSGYGGDDAELNIRGNVTIDGTASAAGRIAFDSPYQNKIGTALAGSVLTLGANESIITLNTGSVGEISVNLVNHGTVTVGTGTITLDAPAVTNLSLMQTGGTGHLNFSNTSVANAGGTISISGGGQLNLSGTTIAGGNLTFAAGGQLNASGSTISAGATLAGAAGAGASFGGAMTLDGSAGAVSTALPVNLATNAVLTVVATINNTGTLALNDTDGYGGNWAEIIASGAATIAGAGSVVFQSANQNIIDQANVGDSLTIGAGQSITTASGGKGEIRATLVNNGLVDANGGTITLDTRGVTNSGNVQARNGGVVAINGIMLTNSGSGVATVGAGSSIALSSAGIAGGTINNGGSIGLSTGSALLNATINNAGAINIVSGNEPITGTLHNASGASVNIGTGGTLPLSAGSVYDNQGTILLNDTDPYGGNSAALHINGTVTVDGVAGHAGQITFGTGNQNYLAPANGSTDQLVIGANQSLVSAGTGYVSVNLANNGTIDAAGSYLEFDSILLSNNGTLHVGTGGLAYLNGASVAATSPAGTMTVDAGGNINAAGVTVSGGTLSGGGTFNITGSSTFDGSVNPIATSSVLVTVPTGKALTLRGMFSNGGTFAANDTDPYTGNSAALYVDGAVSVAGTGQFLFKTGNQNVIAPANLSGDSLTLQAGQTVTTAAGAAGTISVATVNNGLIQASGGAITLASNAFVNNGQINATAGGMISLSGASLNNTAGSISISGTSSLALSGSSLTGGSVGVAASSAITLTNSSIIGGTFATGGTANIGGTTLFNAAAAALTVGSASVPTSATLVVQGPLTSLGTLRLADTDNYGGNFAYLRVDGSATVDGTAASPGTILFATANQNQIIGTNVGDTLTVGAHETVINGSGSAGVIATATTNNGVIDAAAPGSITLTSPVTNNQSMQADGGGTLTVSGTTISNSSAGQVVIAGGSTLNLSNSALVGGTLSSAGTMNLNPAVVSSNYSNSGSAAVFNGVSTVTGALHNTATGVVSVATGGELHLKGGSLYDNQGAIALNDTDPYGGNSAVLRIDGNVMVDGSSTNPGVIRFATGNQNVIAPSRVTDVLSIGGHQTILSPPATAGSITVGLNNAGTVTAQGTIAMTSIAVSNSGVIGAAAGGTLAISGSTITSTVAGMLSIDPAGVANVTNSTLAGGVIGGGGPLNVGGSDTLDGSAVPLVISAAAVSVTTNNALYLRGTVQNNATMKLSDTDSYGGNFAYLYGSGSATLGGSGQLLFNTPYQNVIAASAIGDTLTVGPAETIATVFGGNGEISIGMVNNGTINASGGSITLDGNAKTNSGTIAATAGGIVNFSALASNYSGNTLSGGTWSVSGNSTMRLQGMNIVTNVASIILDGAGANLYRDNGTTSALGNLAANAAGGSLAIRNGRNFTTAGAFANAGTVDVGAGSVFTAAGPTSWSGGTISGAGLYVTAGLNVANSVTRAGTGLTKVVGSVSLASGAVLDLGQSSMIVDYTGASPAAALQAEVLSAYDGGLWNGAGITSSAAAAHAGTALAVVDNASLHLTAFRGQAIDGTTVLIKYTYYGDANLDGVINADDYALIDRGFALHLTGWTNGDFNYDGVVNSADYLLMDTAYGQQTGALSPGLLAERQAEFGSAYVAALTAAVPEPGSVGGLAVVAAGVFARRRRK